MQQTVIIVAFVSILTVLFADTYKERLPCHCFPSFKGSFVKYAYHLTVGTQRPDCPVSEIRIPFRVIAVEGTVTSTSGVPTVCYAQTRNCTSTNSVYGNYNGATSTVYGKVKSIIFILNVNDESPVDDL